MHRAPLVALGLALVASASSIAAQTCPNPADAFWQNDILPQVPTGAYPLVVIQGLGENEAAGSIFDLPPGSGTHRINQVSVGFGHIGGGSGFVATANVEIYEGPVTFVGSAATLGSKIFDLNVDAGADVQLTSTGINVVDLSPYNIDVDDDFVVAFRITFNPNGNPTTGYVANFFTEANTLTSCVGTPGVNLLDWSGIGWVDPVTYLIPPISFPFCPNYYNGNWVIRACTEQVGGPPASVAFRNAGTNPASYFMVAPPVLGSTYTGVVNLAGTTGHSLATVAGYLSPLTFALAGGQTILVNIADPGGELLSQPLVAGPVAGFNIPLPANTSLAGIVVYTQAVHYGGVNPWVLSNSQDLTLGF